MPKKRTVRIVDRTEREVDAYVEPVRNAAFRRYPLLFSCLVAFGGVATFLGIERILLRYDILNQYPFLILAMGLVTLALTGRLYKKLSRT